MQDSRKVAVSTFSHVAAAKRSAQSLVIDVRFSSFHRERLVDNQLIN